MKLAKVVTDIICGDEEKFKQGVYEIKTSVSEKTKNGFANNINSLDLSKKDDINTIVPNLVGEIQLS